MASVLALPGDSAVTSSYALLPIRSRLAAVQQEIRRPVLCGQRQTRSRFPQPAIQHDKRLDPRLHHLPLALVYLSSNTHSISFDPCDVVMRLSRSPVIDHEW